MLFEIFRKEERKRLSWSDGGWCWWWAGPCVLLVAVLSSFHHSPKERWWPHGLTELLCNRVIANDRK